MNKLREAIKEFFLDNTGLALARESAIDEIIAIFREHTEFKPLPGGLRELDDQQLSKELDEVVASCVTLDAKGLLIDNTPLVRWVRLRADKDEASKRAWDRWLCAVDDLEAVSPNHTFSVWVVLQEGHRPYLSTVEHTPGYYQSLKAQGVRVHRAEIEIPGYVIDDGKVKAVVTE